MSLKDYFITQAQLTVQYGDRCVLLMQEGSFYESYGYDVDYCLSEHAKVDKDGQVWSTSVGHAKELAVVLSVVLSQKNKEQPYGITNPHKIGFPMIALEDKYLPVLLANDYTVVRMDQYKLPGSNKIYRKVTEVHSPVMEVEYIPSTATSSQVIAIYLEYCKSKSVRLEKSAALAGIAVIDVISGVTKVSEYYSTAEDREMPFQYIYRFLVAHQPREIVIHAVDVPVEMAASYESLLRKVFELHRYDRVTVHINTLHKEYRTIPYHENVLQQTFQPCTGMMGAFQIINPKIMADLNLESFQYARTALVILINYCHQFNSLVINELLPPETSWLNAQDHLVLAHNALLQLEVMPPIGSKSKDIDSLFSVLNRCRTAVGRRRLSNLLQNPLTDITALNRSYTIIDELINTNLHQTIDMRLQELPDLARLQRRLLLRTITPKEMAVLYNSYQKIIGLYVEILQSDTVCLKEELLDTNTGQEFNKFFATYAPQVNFLSLETCNFDTTENALDYPVGSPCPILPGHFPELDSQVTVLTTAEQHLNNIIQYLNNALMNEKGTAKVHISEPKQKSGATKRSDFSPTILVSTTARAQKLCKLPLDPSVGQLMLREHSSDENQITSSVIAQVTSTIDSARMWIRTFLGNLWQKLLNEFAKYTFYQPLVELVGKWDVYHCYAWVTVHYKYYRPTITEKDNGDYSYCDVKDLRHPFIEQIIKSHSPYVPNDVSLSKNGWLLYGVNSTGKSSLARAVALAVIMAQAGCYVPGHLTYYPFRKIITRILGGDNTKTGQSSYDVELEELRTILRQADQYTLVVGDELAKGTETDSATALTIATMRWLSRVKCCYIFATHMHHITDHPDIVACLQSQSLAIKHLSLQYDPVQDVLIYLRKLQDGSGSAYYGLMVARAKGLPKEFLEDAHRIVEEMQKNTFTTTKSRYNSGLFMQQCMDCGSKEHLHTHHIQPQEHADAQGMIGHMPKDIRSNIMVLCENCHQRWHREGKVAVVQDTSQGIIITSSSSC